MRLSSTQPKECCCRSSSLTGPQRAVLSTYQSYWLSKSGFLHLPVSLDLYSRAGKERITLEDLKRFLEVQEHLLRQPYVPYNVHFFQWIEDAVSHTITSLTYCLLTMSMTVATL